jgi:hypothetical protein
MGSLGLIRPPLTKYIALDEVRSMIPFRSKKAPCYGFLNNNTYYLRARASDREVQTVFGAHEFKWLA